MTTTVIPTPPIKCKMRRYDAEGSHKQTRTGRIVAWQVNADDDGVYELFPVVWPSDESSAFVFGHTDNGAGYWEVSPADDWEA